MLVYTRMVSWTRNDAGIERNRRSTTVYTELYRQSNFSFEKSYLFFLARFSGDDSIVDCGRKSMTVTAVASLCISNSTDVEPRPDSFDLGAVCPLTLIGDGIPTAGVEIPHLTNGYFMSVTHVH